MFKFVVIVLLVVVGLILVCGYLGSVLVVDFVYLVLFGDFFGVLLLVLFVYGGFYYFNDLVGEVCDL